MDKKPRKTDDEAKAIVMNLCFINDVLFEKYAEDSLACEELIQAALENPNLRVKPETLVPQKEIKNIAKRSVRLDAYIEGKEDIIYNIEIQRADNCNHVKRVRFNASCLTVSRSEPGDEFEDVQNVCVIYISEFDMFGEGKTMYHAETTVRETGKPAGDGLQAVYINTAVNDGSKIARLMKHFLEPDFNDPEFPCTTNRMKELKHNPKEVEKVCKSVEMYAEKKAIRATITTGALYGASEEQIVTQLMKDFKMDRETAVSYYEEFSPQPV